MLEAVPTGGVFDFPPKYETGFLEIFLIQVGSIKLSRDCHVLTTGEGFKVYMSISIYLYLYRYRYRYRYIHKYTYIYI